MNHEMKSNLEKKDDFLAMVIINLTECLTNQVESFKNVA